MLPRIKSRISRSLHVQLSDFLLRASRRWINSDCHHVQWKAQVSVQWPQFPIKSVLAAIRWDEFCSGIWTALATIKRSLHCKKLPALWYPRFLLLGLWKPYVARREDKQPLCLIFRPVNKNKRTQLGRFSRQKDVFREGSCFVSVFQGRLRIEDTGCDEMRTRQGLQVWAIPPGCLTCSILKRLTAHPRNKTLEDQ